MSEKTVTTILQLRRGTQESWNAVGATFVPKEGEPCLTMDGEDKNRVKYGDGVSTWNELEYSGSTVSATQFFEGAPQGEETDQQVIERVVGETPLFPGDVFIVNHTISASIISKTAYNYDGSQWVAMDGNYNAENVYLGSDLTITANIGVQTIDSTGSKTLNTTGKNIKQVLDLIMAEEKNPTTTQPSVNISSTTAKGYEAGTQVTPAYSATLNAGSYSYGPATGIIATSWSVVDSISSGTKTTASGTFDQITVGDDTNYTITATANYGQGAMPVTNLGNEYPAGQIQAGNKSKTSAAITGFRQIFYGVRTSSDIPDSAAIRALTNTNNKASARTLTISASAGAQQLVVAIPQSSGLSIKSANITTSLNADVTSLYVNKGPIEVQGANGYTAVPYKVYIYQPASIDPTEVHSVVIG